MGQRSRTALVQTAAVMEATAESERRVAAVLRSAAARGGGQAAGRRLKMASEADRAAAEAGQFGEYLLSLAERWSERADTLALRRLLAHADRVLAELARTEQDIAGTLSALASRSGPDLAAQRRRAAGDAAASAGRARERAQALRHLAGASTAKMRPADQR